MKKFTMILGISVLLAVSFVVASGFTRQSFAAQEVQNQEFLSVDEIEKGMRGRGSTVFEEIEPDDFDVEIIGVRRIVEGWSLITVRLSGGPLTDTNGNPIPLEEAGVISAMSGSPVYIDGKLIGALGYKIGGNQKTYEAYGAITPIGLMVKEGGSILSKKSQLALLNISPIKTPLLVSGFTEKALNNLVTFFEKRGLEVKIDSLDSPSASQEKNSPQLKPGSSIMVVYMRGDFWAGASGTVTYIDGKKVYAFGHALEELRDVDFPFYQSKVHMVIVGEDSFKMSGGVVGESLGAIRKDFFAGIVGVLGEEAQMIPVKVNLKKSNETADFKVEIVNHRLLSKDLIVVTLYNALYLFQPDLSFSTIKLDMRLKIKGADTLEISDVFLTSQDGLGREFDEKIIQGVLDPLFVSPFEFEIESVEFDVEILEGENILVLDKAFLTKNTELVGAGSVIMKKSEGIDLTLVLKDIKTGEHHSTTFPIPIIEDVDEGTVRIRIDSGRSIELLKVLDRPQSPKEQIEQLAEYYFSNNVVYLQIIYPLEQEEPEEIKISSGQTDSGSQEAVSHWKKITEEERPSAKTKEEEIKLIKVPTPFKGVIIAGEVLTFRIEKPKEEPEEQPEEDVETGGKIPRWKLYNK